MILKHITLTNIFSRLSKIYEIYEIDKLLIYFFSHFVDYKVCAIKIYLILWGTNLLYLKDVYAYSLHTLLNVVILVFYDLIIGRFSTQQLTWLI